MRHGFTVSDLHLFTHWSTAAREMPAIVAAARRSDFLVLNGDIFDFRWSTLPTLERTVTAAVGWLDELAAACPRCRVVYLMGNHDRMSAMTAPLAKLSGRRGNFLWHSSHMQIHGALFLHGDLALRADLANPFQRTLRGKQWKPGPAARMIYRSLTAARVHCLAKRFNSPRHCAKRILRSLAQHGEGLDRSIRDVYFGHTHRPFHDFMYDGVRFHNTGAAIRGLRMNLLEIRL
ncbi:MAG: metallophosphoesterase [Planctomycetota bacterium]|nr:metallophosphoesterase [Planctomycetota bacterium]